MSRPQIKKRPAKPATGSSLADSLGSQYPVNLTWGELKSLYRNPPHRKTIRQILEKKEQGS